MPSDLARLIVSEAGIFNEQFQRLVKNNSLAYFSRLMTIGE